MSWQQAIVTTLARATWTRGRAYARREPATIAAYGLAVALFAASTAYSPSFAAPEHVRVLLVVASFIGIAALGQTLIILAGGLDLSVPWLIAFGGIQIQQIGTQLPVGGVAAVLVVIAMGMGLGAINGLIVVGTNAPPLVVTLGVGGMILAYLQAIGQPTGFTTTATNIAGTLANGRLGGIPIAGVVWLLMAAAVSVFLSRTGVGRRIYAVGTSPRAARLSGISVARVRLATYIIGGGTATFAGIMIAGYVQSAYIGMGSDYLFGSVAAVALGGVALLGGLGTYWGTVAGALTLTILSALLPLLGMSQPGLQITYGAVILSGVFLATRLRARSERLKGGNRGGLMPATEKATSGDWRLRLQRRMRRR